VDSMHRLGLKVDGADTAAREVKKLSKAFGDVEKAASRVKGSAGGGDASDKATLPGGGGGAGIGASSSEVGERQGRNKKDRDAAAEREQRNREQAGQRFYNRAGQAGNQAGGGVENVANNNTLGAIGSAGEAAGGALASTGYIGAIAGAGLLVGGIALKVMSSLAQRERERLDTIVGSGMAQRLGSNYSDMRSLRLNLGREGIPRQMSDAVMQAFSQSGGSYNEAAIRRGSQLSMITGIEGGTIGRYMGTAMAGGGSGMPQDIVFQRAQRAFGSQSHRFIETLTEALEQSMESGAERGGKRMSEITEETSKRLLSFTTVGNLSASGAIALERSTRQMQYSPAGIQNMSDFMRFMEFQQPGESYAETRRRMTSPNAFSQHFQNLRAMYPDDESLGMRLMSEDPTLTQNQIDALIRSNGGTAGGDGSLPGMPQDARGVQGSGLYAGLQAEPFQQLEAFAAKTNADLNIWAARIVNELQGIRTPGQAAAWVSRRVGAPAREGIRNAPGPLGDVLRLMDLFEDQPTAMAGDSGSGGNQ
jgi:hypothetical protein